MSINKVLKKVYENKTLGGSGKNKANSKPNKANSKPIKANKMPKQSQFKPNQTQFQRLKILLRMTINGWRKSFAYYADEIEAPKAYDRGRLFKIFDIPPSFSADK